MKFAPSAQTKARAMNASPRAATSITRVAILWPILLAVAILALGRHNGPLTYVLMAVASFALATVLIVWKRRMDRLHKAN